MYDFIKYNSTEKTCQIFKYIGVNRKDNPNNG